jgi:hypothetical protein
MNRLRKRTGIGMALAIASALTLALVVRERSMAQSTGATGSPPPTYDYNSAAPGVQPPTSPLLANPAARELRTHQLGVSVLVPLAEMQAVLPPGFTAVESAPGSGMATVGMGFIYQARFEQTGAGTFGPVSGTTVIHTARNTNADPPRLEAVFLALELSDPAAVAAANAVFGPGSSRLARTKVDIKEEGGRLRLRFHVVDEALGFNVKVSAEGPAHVVTRSQSDPVPVPWRFLNNGGVPNPPLRAAFQGDINTIPSAAADVDVSVVGRRLRLPGGGRLTVMGVGPSVSFWRWVEVVTRPE